MNPTGSFLAGGFVEEALFGVSMARIASGSQKVEGLRPIPA